MRRKYLYSYLNLLTPLELIDMFYRRVAAVSLAKRVADETQTELGTIVGYR